MSMEASEIIRRNEAVARFMGLEWDGEEGCWSDPRKGEYGLFTSRALRYDRDYSWLMPCVEKILSHKTSMIGSLIAIAREENGEFKVLTAGGNIGHEKTMIEAMFLAVSEYCLSLEA